MPNPRKSETTKQREGGRRRAERAAVALQLKKLPKPPAILRAPGRREWRARGGELVKMKLLARADLGTFTTYCLGFDLLDQAVRNGEPDDVRKAIGQIRLLAQQFGLTPNARAGLTPATTAEDTDADDAFLKLVG